MANVPYDQQRTALLVIDPYNDCIAEGGKVWDRLQAVAEANRCVPHMVQVLHAARLEKITDLFDRGKLTARVGTVLPLEQARTAHEMLGGAPHSRGKIVLNVAGGSSRGGDERVESSVGGIPGCAWRISAGGTESTRRKAMTR